MCVTVSDVSMCETEGVCEKKRVRERECVRASMGVCV